MAKLFSDHLLNIPRKIDFFHYAPCAGGEFFTSVILCSHPKTRKILEYYDFHGFIAGKSGREYEYTAFLEGMPIVHRDNGALAFKKFNYKNYVNPMTADLMSNRMDNFSAEEIIDLHKFLLINSIIKTKAREADDDPEIFDDVIFLSCNHYYFKPVKMEKVNSYPHWDWIDINPQSKFGRELLYKMDNRLEVTNQKIRWDAIAEALDSYPFLEKFPFLDYILDKDYDGICDWLRNKYGSDLDFDFIKKRLEMWRDLRVNPYL